MSAKEIHQPSSQITEDKSQRLSTKTPNLESLSSVNLHRKRRHQIQNSSITESKKAKQEAEKDATDTPRKGRKQFTPRKCEVIHSKEVTPGKVNEVYHNVKSDSSNARAQSREKMRETEDKMTSKLKACKTSKSKKSLTGATEKQQDLSGSDSERNVGIVPEKTPEKQKLKGSKSSKKSNLKSLDVTAPKLKTLEFSPPTLRSAKKHDIDERQLEQEKTPQKTKLSVKRKTNSTGDSSAKRGKPSSTLLVSGTDEAGSDDGLHNLRLLSEQILSLNEASTSKNKKSAKAKIKSSSGKDTPEDSRLTESDASDELEIVEDGNEGTIDKMLEESAKKSNLSAKNVKNILHHVITNHHVLEMVKNSIREAQEAGELTPAVYEPKMTRTKVKQIMEKEGSIPHPWPLSPLKKPSSSHPTPNFLDLSFGDDEEDDEYDPSKDEQEHESDADSESVMSSQASDFGSPLPATPGTPKTPSSRLLPSDEETPRQTISCGLVEKHVLPAMVPMGPPQLPTRKKSGEDDATIAYRTRSKLPLYDTSLEAIESTFVAPDITPDMYDTVCDDQDWQEFLAGLMKSDVQDPPASVPEFDETEDDPEYNIMAEEEEIDLEDYRCDKAVKVTKKELNELMDELLEVYGDLLEEEFTEVPPSTSTTVPTTQAKPPRLTVAELQEMKRAVKVVKTDDEIPEITPDQRLQIDDQMRKYVQILTQTYILANGRAEFQTAADQCHKFMNELDRFSKNIVQPENSTFSAINLTAALDIVNADSYIMGSPQKPKKKGRGITSPELSFRQMETLLHCSALLYPKLLPSCDILPLEESFKLKKIVFLGPEDNLLALGMEQFHHIQGFAKYIRQYLLPTKTEKQIHTRIKNLSANKTGETVIKYFRRLHHAPEFPRFITLISELKPPISHVADQLPPWYMKYKSLEQEASTSRPSTPDEIEKQAELTDAIKKIDKEKENQSRKSSERRSDDVNQSPENGSSLSKSSPDGVCNLSSNIQKVKHSRKQKLKNRQDSLSPCPEGSVLPEKKNESESYVAPQTENETRSRKITYRKRKQIVTKGTSKHTDKLNNATLAVPTGVIGQQTVGQETFVPVSKPPTIVLQVPQPAPMPYPNVIQLPSSTFSVLQPRFATCRPSLVNNVVVLPSVPPAGQILRPVTASAPAPLVVKYVSVSQTSDVLPSGIMTTNIAQNPLPNVRRSLSGQLDSPAHNSLSDKEAERMEKHKRNMGIVSDEKESASEIVSLCVSTKKRESVILLKACGDVTEPDINSVCTDVTQQQTSSTASPKNNGDLNSCNRTGNALTDETIDLVHERKDNMDTGNDDFAEYLSRSETSVDVRRNKNVLKQDNKESSVGTDCSVSVLPHEKIFPDRQEMRSILKCSNKAENIPNDSHIYTTPKKLLPLLLPKTPTSATKTPVSPFLKKLKSPRRKILQQQAKAILPKGFIFNANLSPTKRIANEIRARARQRTNQKFGRKKSLSYVKRKNSKSVPSESASPNLDTDHDSCEAPGQETDFTSEYDTVDSDIASDSEITVNQATNQSAEELMKKSRPRPDWISQLDNVESDDDNAAVDLDTLMEASSTIRYEPNKMRHDKYLKSKKRKKQLAMAMMASDIVESDPLRDERDMAFAQAYLTRVQDIVPAGSYFQFLKILGEFNGSDKTPVQLYQEVHSLFDDHAGLIDDFACFLLPSQAVECGCLVPNLEFRKARSFLRKVEVYFGKHPTHFRKILKAFTSWYANPEKSNQSLREAVGPLLRDQPHLIQDFSQCFPDEKPLERSFSDYEEVSLSEDEEKVGDGYETVKLPEEENYCGTVWCMCDCHDTKNARYLQRKRHCKLCRLRIIGGRIYIQSTEKCLRPAQIIYPCGSPEIPQMALHEDDYMDDDIVINDECDELDDDGDDNVDDVDDQDDNGENNVDDDDDDEDDDADDDDDDEDDGDTEDDVDENSLSDVEIMEAFENKSKKPQAEAAVNSTKETTSLTFQLTSDRPSSRGTFVSLEVIARNSPQIEVIARNSPQSSFNPVVSCPDSGSDFSQVLGRIGQMSRDKVMAEVPERTDPLLELPETIGRKESVENQSSTDSQNAMLEFPWTKEEDKQILEQCKTNGPRKETFEAIATVFPSRTPKQVSDRFQTLMQLFCQEDDDSSGESGSDTESTTNP